MSESDFKGLKTTAAIAAALGRGVRRTVRWAVHCWRGLLPLMCAAGAGVFAAGSQLFAWLYGPAAWAWIAVVAALLWVVMDGQIGKLAPKARPPAIALLIYAVAATIALIVAGSVVEVYLAVLLAMLGLGIWWWQGDAYRRFKGDARAQRRMETVVGKLQLTGTRVTSTAVKGDGSIEWRLYLGDNDRPGQVTRGDIAHLLKTTADRIVVRRANKNDSRSLKVVLLAKSLEVTGSVAHPAATAEGRAEGSGWEPGVRRIAEGAPIGPAMADATKISTLHFYEVGYGARHILIAGMTGAGKSVTANSGLAHGAACIDARQRGVDLVKGGETFLPWYEAQTMDSLIYLPADKADNPDALLEGGRALLKELAGLRSEVARRTALMASGQVRDADGERTRVWPASPKHPVIVFYFEEYASTLTAIRDLDPNMADAIEEATNNVARTARSSGISMVILTQRPVHEELPMALRGQLSQTILHKLNTPNDQGKLWPGYDVDPVRVLAGGKGLCYVDHIGGADPVLTKAYNLSKPKVCSEIAAAYASTPPTVRTPEAAAVTSSAPTPAEPPVHGDDTPSVLANALTDDGIPRNAPIISGPADSKLDPVKRKAILDALAAAESKGLARVQVEPVIEASATATKVALVTLMDEGLVTTTGTGKSTRYHLTADALAGV